MLWNDAWYSGHLVPGYSLIYPPLGALLGPRLVAVLAALGSAVAFAALLRSRRPGRAADLAALWFALGAGALIYTGRITFLLGLALGLLALLVLPRAPAAALLAALAALASPVAGLFTGIAGAALLLGGRVREGLAIGAGATVATLALVLAFPVGGIQPFGLSSFWWVAVACAIAIALIPPRMRTLRIGMVLYGVVLIAFFVVESPVGSNAPRLGALMMGPVAALVLADRRPRLLALLALPLLYWQLAAPIGDLLRGTGEDSTEASFYAPLLAQLDERTGGWPARVEVPATRERWEAVYVAASHPLARGWMRQLESDDIDRFTGENLTPETYRSWLDEHGVSFVALPHATLDYLSEEEGWLLSNEDLPFLREVFSDDDWTLWEVLPESGRFAPGAALAGGGARVTDLGPDGFSVIVPGPGDYTVRMRWTSYFEVAAGDACVSDGGEGSTIVSVPEEAAGRQLVRVEARLSIDGLLGRDRSCSG